MPYDALGDAIQHKMDQLTLWIASLENNQLSQLARQELIDHLRSEKSFLEWQLRHHRAHEKEN